MKKKVTITAVVIICILLGVAVALSANRAGGEIGFEATINSVENGVAYATVNKQDAGFLAPKLPGNIEFNTSDLDVTLQAGDEISGCYLSGTINGSSVRVVKKYLHNELEADTDDKTAGNSRTHIVFRKVWKTVAVAAITLTLLFSTVMVANAQFRERVVSWVIETFEKYGIFELHGDELDEPQDLTEYQAGYLPDGAILQDTTKQPNKEPEVVIHRYTIGESEDFEILITPSNNRVYFDTEKAEIKPLEKDGLTGYSFKKDDMTYICFERDGRFFSVYGTADADELLKVAAGITKK